MNLLLAGGYLGEQGILRANIKKVVFGNSLEELKTLKPPFFLVLSYDLSSQTLCTKIKESPFPNFIALEIESFSKATPLSKPSFLIPKKIPKEETFKRKILKVKDYIERGDVYQINLTAPFEFHFQGPLEAIFWNFYLRQKVPYAFFLDLGDLKIVSGTMELFLKREKDKILSKPIKGTGKSKEEILLSEKERAENLMITDMVRNDLGKIAETGSVRVSELFKVTEYETLYQMHSTVEAKTKASFEEIIRSTFPPASVTGAPKRRAVEIIDLLEEHARGYYCGAGGLVLNEDNFTLSVLIRTAYGTGDTLTYFAGCGIVWDSDPDKEVRELFLKVKAFCDLESLARK